MSSSERISAEQRSAHQLREKLPEMVASVRILVVGDVMLDRYWFGDVSRISPEAPVPVVQIQRQNDRLGGAANVARNVAALGAHVTLAGIVGRDEAAGCVQSLLERERIHSRLQIDPGTATTIKLRVLSRRQQMLRIDFDSPQKSDFRLDADFLSPLLKSHDAVVFSDYAKGCVSEPQSWITEARTLGLHVVVDPKARDFSRYAHATVLKPNLSEFTRAAGVAENEKEFTDKAQSLRDSLRIESLLITRSEQGMSLYDSTGDYHFPARIREVYDVCGAGDTAAAVTVTLLAAGLETRLSVWLANHAAGIAVTRAGVTAVKMNELVSSLS